MVLIIKVKNNEELKKLDKFLKENSIEVIEEKHSIAEKSKELRSMFSKYNLKLPKDFKFSREEANAR